MTASDPITFDSVSPNPTSHNTSAHTPITPRAASQHTLTPGQVAAMFNVNPKTVARWASSGILGAIRTPGGHRRFREADVVALLNRKVED
ncbi:BldC family transcriptional regulator [Williamsia sterculiae]|uniref:DNA binding domain-containing protein, excisionase family n=1 Tax=Williamsia sterculiae TaxID=1344003 RepID=A0A1N7CXE2_9NOCA|nr:BldC family transcriptional regulator [Williamsia sterculiae]SIR68308.1 DNA binding domain-containing protein, excisionase family [Williamsia sterculiae]